MWLYVFCETTIIDDAATAATVIPAQAGIHAEPTEEANGTSHRMFLHPVPPILPPVAPTSPNHPIRINVFTIPDPIRELEKKF